MIDVSQTKKELNEWLDSTTAVQNVTAIVDEELVEIRIRFFHPEMTHVVLPYLVSIDYSPDVCVNGFGFHVFGFRMDDIFATLDRHSSNEIMVTLTEALEEAYVLAMGSQMDRV